MDHYAVLHFGTGISGQPGGRPAFQKDGWSSLNRARISKLHKKKEGI
jgi:hypothetical protein